jgi:hypothetical protein
VPGADLLAPLFPGSEDLCVREGRQESYEGVVCCYAGGVEVRDLGEEMEVCGGVVEAGWGEGGRHFYWLTVNGYGIGIGIAKQV